ATLSLNSASPTTTLSMSSFTLSGGTINFALGSSGNPSVPVVNTAALSRDGTNTVNVFGSNFSLGTITLVQYAGAAGGSGSFTLGALPGHVFANLIDTGSALNLNITGFDQSRWTGALDSTWNANTSPSPKNWVLNSNGT